MENLIIKRFADENSASIDCTVISAAFPSPSNAIFSIVSAKNGQATETIGAINSREDFDREIEKLDTQIQDLQALREYLARWTEPVNE